MKFKSNRDTLKLTSLLFLLSAPFVAGFLFRYFPFAPLFFFPSTPGGPEDEASDHHTEESKDNGTGYPPDAGPPKNHLDRLSLGGMQDQFQPPAKEDGEENPKIDPP